MRWIDSHCHIQGEYGSQWNNSLDAIRDAAGSDVTGIVCVGTDLDTSREGIELTLQLRDLLSGYSAQTGAVSGSGVSDSTAEQTTNNLSRFGLWCTAGIHPHDAATWKDNMGELEKLITTTSDNHPGMLVGIGECGLDYHYENSSKESQMAAFAGQIKLAKEYDLTLVIHAREAWDDIFAVLATEGAPQRSIMHCFTGGPDELSTALSFGAYISFSGIVTFSNAANIREAAKECPPERILIETDSPFLSPTPNRGKPNRPAWVALVGDEIGALKGMSRATIQDITYSNTLRAFKITTPNETGH
jgi:TatD DNase family protein